MAALNSVQGIGEVINFGSNFEISIGETAHLIAEIMGVNLEIETDEARLRPEKSEVERLFASNTKARELLGWSPQFGEREGFKKGLMETISWFEDPENLKSYKADIYNV